MQAWELILVPDSGETLQLPAPAPRQEEVMRSTMNMEQCNGPHVTHLTHNVNAECFIVSIVCINWINNVRETQSGPGASPLTNDSW